MRDPYSVLIRQKYTLYKHPHPAFSIMVVIVIGKATEQQQQDDVVASGVQVVVGIRMAIGK